MSTGDYLSSGHVPNYWNNPPNTFWKVYVADSIGLGFALTAVVARCYTKVYVSKSPGWEDYTSILSFLCFLAFVIMDYVRGSRYGGGRHAWDLPEQYIDPTIQLKSICTYIYVIGIMFAKVSLLLFLYRIFRVNLKFRIVSWIIGAVVVIWTTVSFFLMVFTCSPIGATWNHKLRLDPKTHCGKPQNVVIYQGYCNIITDFCLLILPIPLGKSLFFVWNLQMNMRKKLGLATVFATGIVICIISIVRQYIIYHTNKDTDDWVATKNIVWLSIEFSLSIIVACLPALTPLLKHMSGLSNLIPSIIRSRFTLKSSEKLPGDVEHGSHERYPQSPWQTPREWKKPGHKQSFDTRGSKESEMALQPMQPTHRELNHKD